MSLNVAELDSYYLKNKIFGEAVIKDNKYRMRLTIFLYLLFNVESLNSERASPTADNLKFLTGKVYQDCFYSRDEKYTKKIIGCLLPELLNNGLGEFKIGKHQFNKNNYISLDKKEFFEIVNAANKEIQYGKLKVESLLIIFLFFKHLSFVSSLNSPRENAFDVSYKTISKYTGICHSQIKRYLDCLEAHNLIYSCWLGNYTKDINGHQVVVAAPTIYTLHENYGAMIRKTCILKDLLSTKNNQVRFTNADTLYELWQIEKEKKERNLEQ